MNYWITCADERYLKFTEVLVKSLLKTSKYPIIIYGLNCDVFFDYPNVIKRRLDFDFDATKTKTDFSKLHFNLKDKEWSNLFAKYMVSLDALNQSKDDDVFCFLDSDIITLTQIDSIFEHSHKITKVPLYMKYFHSDILIWKGLGDFKIEAKYGSEICNVFGIKRNPFKKILAGGLFLFNKSTNWFFTEALITHNQLKTIDFYVWADERAFSEEVVANYLCWKYNISDSLPIKWVNRNNSKSEIVNYGFTEYIYGGFDLMFDYERNIPLFLHGPDPTFTKKIPTKLKSIYDKLYSDKKSLMIVAHPDDELIFGGQELIRYGKKYKVVCVSSGYDLIRSSEFKSVMEGLGISDYEIWNYEDDLYKPFSEDLLNDLKRIIGERKWDKIVTHNPVGEYGHPQHRDLYLKVRSITDDIYVFCKTPHILDTVTLSRKRELLKMYPSQYEIINQLEVKNGRWYLSNDDTTDYIRYSDISKYSTELDKTEYIRCVDK